MKRLAVSLLTASLLGTPTAQALEWEPISDTPRQASPAYRQVIRDTASMSSNSEAQALAQKYGLQILNLTWEDTGRYKNSAVGPNISDMTIQVGTQNPDSRQFESALMPVIRYPNFSDQSADIDPREFTLLVGNEKGDALKRISLYDFLKDPTRYLSKASSWRAKNKSLLAERDSKVLVSAQAAFLPIPQSDKATFNPVLFNYQSISGDPAVLTILATREGTSVTVIDNKRDGFSAGSSWGQRLFHNKNGERTSLTGERISDFVAHGGDATSSASEAQGKGRQGLSMVLLIQVPLKQKHPMIFKDEALGASGCMNCKSSVPTSEVADRRSNVEVAVIGHGKIEGPFTEIDNLTIERDERFPIRVTVQFYKATSNGVVNEGDMAAIHNEIQKVYAHGSAVGSLVVGGETGRATEYAGSKLQPAAWWDEFWKRYTDNTGETREEAVQRLQALLGTHYRWKPVSELYLRDVLRNKATS